MTLGVASLLKLWITVVLSTGTLVATVEVDSTSSPFKSDRSEDRNGAAVPASFSHSFYPSGLVREQLIPHSNDEVVYVDEGGQASTDEEEEDELKRSMGMLRLGRASSSLDKRARTMAALRLGRSLHPSAPADQQAEAWRSAANSWKRTMGMLRLGRRSEDDEDQEEQTEDAEEKRSMGMLRLGRSNSRQHQHLQSEAEPSSAAGDKRSMGMLRLGRSGLRGMLSR